MSQHLMNEAAFLEAEAGWMQTLSLAQNMSIAIEGLENAMIAATFGTFEDVKAQTTFETRTLPCAITAVMNRHELENDAPAQVFLQHCIEFFIRTIDRDNETLMDALRPVMVFRPAASNNPRIRAPTNGPYEFYNSNILPADRSEPLYGVRMPPSLYREYNRERRRGTAATAAAAAAAAAAQPPIPAGVEATAPGPLPSGRRMPFGNPAAEDGDRELDTADAPASVQENKDDTRDPPPPKDGVSSDTEGDARGEQKTAAEPGNGGSGDLPVAVPRANVYGEVKRRDSDGSGARNDDGKGEGHRAAIAADGRKRRDISQGVGAIVKIAARKTKEPATAEKGEDMSQRQRQQGPGQPEHKDSSPPEADANDKWGNGNGDDDGLSGDELSDEQLIASIKDLMELAREPGREGDETRAKLADVLDASDWVGLSPEAVTLVETAYRLVQEGGQQGDNEEDEGGFTGEEEGQEGEGHGDGWGRMQVVLDPHKAKALFEDGYDETCPYYLSNLNWFICLDGVGTLERRLAATPAAKATIVRGVVEMLCTVAEVVPNELAEKILRATRCNLDRYLKGVSSDDLKRSPENRIALFGAVDNVSYLTSTLSHLPREDRKAALEIRYGLCHQHFKCPTLQLRLSGLMELSKAIHQMQLSFSQQQHQVQHFHLLQQKEMEERISKRKLMSQAEKLELRYFRTHGGPELDVKNWVGQDLATWMLRDRLMELLFSAEFLHTETLKRSGDIPRSLAWLGKLSNDHVRLIWDAARQSAHESIRHAVLQLLQGLFPNLIKEQLDLVNTFAHELPKSEFDGRTLLLLKHLAAASMKLEKDRMGDLTETEMAEIESLAAHGTAAAAAAAASVWGGSPGGSFDACVGVVGEGRTGAMSGLEVLRECVLGNATEEDRGALPLELHEEALTCLAHSVGQLGGGLPCSVDPRVWLLDEVVTCLKKRTSVVQALRLLRALLESFHQSPILVVKQLKQVDQAGEEMDVNDDEDGPGQSDARDDTVAAAAEAGGGTAERDGHSPRGVSTGDREEGEVAARQGTDGGTAASPDTKVAPAASAASQPRRKRRRSLSLAETSGRQIVKVMGITDLALEELMQYKEYAFNKVRELGLGFGETADVAVLEYKAYPHLDAMRYRLRLLQTLVCMTSHVITEAQAEGLWLGLVERALSAAELDLSFEALLGLRRETPQGLPTLAKTFFQRMCRPHRARGRGDDPGADRSTSTTNARATTSSCFDLHKLRPSGFRFFMYSLEATNLALGRLRPRRVPAPTVIGGARLLSGSVGAEDELGPRQGPMPLEVDDAEGLGGGARSAVGGGGTGVDSLPKYVVVSMGLEGLEALWSIALEVEAEDVSEAAIKKLCELCLHVEVSDDLTADAVARERASFVSRCTERLAQAAKVLSVHADTAADKDSGAGSLAMTGGAGGDSAVAGTGGEGAGRKDGAQRRQAAAVVSATRSLQLLLAYLEEAGGRMRAQGLSMHSHSGNQVISRTMTIRIHVCTGKTVELDMFPHHTLQHLRLAVAHSQGADWTAATTRLLFRGREMQGNDGTLDEQGLLEGGVVQAARRLRPKLEDEVKTITRGTVSIRPELPSTQKGSAEATALLKAIAQTGGKEANSTGTMTDVTTGTTTTATPTSNGIHAMAPQVAPQRGRKRAASSDPGDRTREGFAPTGKFRASNGSVSSAEGKGVTTPTPSPMDVERSSVSSPVVQLPGFFVSGTREGMDVEGSPSVGRGGGAVQVITAAPPELPLLELEKQSTVDTLFELMESGQSVSVLVWELLMNMPTNMSLYNGFSSIGLTTGPQSASEISLSLLQHASPSRLLYSLMIVENLLNRDVANSLDTAGRGALDDRIAMAGATPVGPKEETMEGPPAGAPKDGLRGMESDGEWEALPPGFGSSESGGVIKRGSGDSAGAGAGAGGSRAAGNGKGSWRHRFVKNGGIDTLVELLLTRDWDVTRGMRGGGDGGAWGGEGTVGISLACLALVLGLLEAFVDGDHFPKPPQQAKLVQRIPIILCTTARCYRELASHSSLSGAASSSSSSPSKARHSVTGGGTPSSNGSWTGSAAGSGHSGANGGSCKGEFDPLIEAGKAARSCTAIITSLLLFPSTPIGGVLVGRGDRGGRYAGPATLSDRVSMATELVSSTAFGEAVREALVRSPCHNLRANTMDLMANLAAFDRALAAEERMNIGDDRHEDGSAISLTTVMAQLLVSLVPYCRSEPDGRKCHQLYELLSEFISKGNVDIHLLCAALPGLPPPPTSNNEDSVTARQGNFDDMDGPLPRPASPDERESTSTAVVALSKAVAADGEPALAQAMPLLVWLMRLIVEPRITAADGHLSGLLRLARVIVRWLGPHGKEAVGLRGLMGIAVPPTAAGVDGGRGVGLLFHVYHECLFDIATHENHGPLAAPKCRSENCRANAFGLLTDLATDCRSNVAVLIKLLLEHHSTSSPCQPPALEIPANSPRTPSPHSDTASASARGKTSSEADEDIAGDATASTGVGTATAANRSDTESDCCGGGVERVSWAYAPRQTDKAECGYVGLQNLGATCYMNSLLQQLFMVPALRFGVLSCDPFHRTEEQIAKDVEAVPREENLLFQLQVMFGYLQESEKKFLDTRGMCRACKDAAGQPVDPLEQQDVDEFLLVFLDRLETQLSNLPQQRLLQHVFGGQLCNQLIGQDRGESVCPHVSERNEDFFVLGLDVKGKRSITESLQLYVEGEVLAGDNKFLCAQCDAKRDTLKRTCIARLPNVLFLHLKRFEFDMEQMRKVKVNDSCEFPTELDMRPYTKEGLLARHEQHGAASAGQSSGDNKDEGVGFQQDGQAYPDSYYEYKLAGVLVHSGTADSGHYYSYIKRRDTQGGGGEGPASWFCFNDASVTAFDPASLPLTCYGGYTMSPTGRGMTAKPFSAYMLIYEREYVLPYPTPARTPTSPPASSVPSTPPRPMDVAEDTSAVSRAPIGGVTAPQSEEDLRGSTTRAAPGVVSGGEATEGKTREEEERKGKQWEPPWGGVPRPSELVPPSIFQACWLENRLFLMDKNVFSTEYLNWLCDLTALVPPPSTTNADGGVIARGDDGDVDEVESSAAKVALYLALDTVARARDKERLPQLMLYVKRWFQGSPSICKWALEQMTTNNYWQHTMLLQCSLQGVRSEFLQLCVELCRSFAPTERHLYYEEDPAIGEHVYLAAVRQRERRTRDEADEEPGASSLADESVSKEPDEDGLKLMEAIEGVVGAGILQMVAKKALSRQHDSLLAVVKGMEDSQAATGYRMLPRAGSSSSFESTDGTGGGSDMSPAMGSGSVASDNAEFGDRDEQDWAPPSRLPPGPFGKRRRHAEPGGRGPNERGADKADVGRIPADDSHERGVAEAMDEDEPQDSKRSGGGGGGGSPGERSASAFSSGSSSSSSSCSSTVSGNHLAMALRARRLLAETESRSSSASPPPRLPPPPPPLASPTSAASRARQGPTPSEPSSGSTVRSKKSGRSGTFEEGESKRDNASVPKASLSAAAAAAAARTTGETTAPVERLLGVSMTVWTVLGDEAAAAAAAAATAREGRSLTDDASHTASASLSASLSAVSDGPGDKANSASRQGGRELTSEDGGNGNPRTETPVSRKRPLSALGVVEGNGLEGDRKGEAGDARGDGRDGSAAGLMGDRVGEQRGKRRVAEGVSMPQQPETGEAGDTVSVLCEEVPQRVRWWNSRALVPRFVGTILELLHELRAPSDREVGRTNLRGCGPRRATSLVQMRKQSDHLFELLVEIGRIGPAEKRLLVRAGALPRALHAVLGEACHLVPRELLWRRGEEGRVGGDDTEDDMYGKDPASDEWISGTASFAPFLRLLVELACSCAVVGDDPPPFFFFALDQSRTESSSERDTAPNGGCRAVVPVPREELESCLPVTMDEAARDACDEEIVVLPNESEVRILSESIVLELLLTGRAKPALLSQVRLHADQLQCVLRLARHLCWNSPRATEMLLNECSRGLHEGQMHSFHMHIRVLLGLVGIMDEHHKRRVLQVVDHLVRAAELNLDFNRECLEILRVLARALLGATPDMVPPDTVDDVRQALLGQTEALVTNFVLNIKQSIDVRQMAAFCLQLCIPQVWALNGCWAPRCFSLNNFKLNCFTAFAAPSTIAAATPTAPSTPSVVVPPVTPLASGEGNAVAPAAEMVTAAPVDGWDQARARRAGDAQGGEDMLRKQAEDAAETQAVAAAFGSDDSMRVDGDNSAGSSDDVQFVGVVPGVPGNVPKKAPRNPDSHALSVKREPSSAEASPSGKQQQQQASQQEKPSQHQHQHQQGRENTEMEPPEKKGLSLAAIEAAAWLLHAIMLEVPRVVGVIEVTSAAGDLVNERVLVPNFCELIVLMTNLLTGSKAERDDLAGMLPSLFDSLFKLDRVRRDDDETKGLLLKFIQQVLEKHPDLCYFLKQDNIASSLMVFYISWLDKKSNVEYNTTYSSIYYDILLKAGGLYPSFMEHLRRSSNLQWCLEWFLLRGYAPTMKMASTLMSIVKLCLRRYRYRFAEDAISWILGPRAKEHYLKVVDGPNGRMPLYALWMLETCLREPGGDEESVMDTFVKCGGIDQVTLVLTNIMAAERTPRQTFNRSQLATQEMHRKIKLLCENVLLDVYDWLHEGALNDSRRAAATAAAAAAAAAQRERAQEGAQRPAEESRGNGCLVESTARESAEKADPSSSRIITPQAARRDGGGGGGGGNAQARDAKDRQLGMLAGGAAREGTGHGTVSRRGQPAAAGVQATKVARLQGARDVSAPSRSGHDEESDAPGGESVGDARVSNEDGGKGGEGKRKAGQDKGQGQRRRDRGQDPQQQQQEGTQHTSYRERLELLGVKWTHAATACTWLLIRLLQPETAPIASVVKQEQGEEQGRQTKQDDVAGSLTECDWIPRKDSMILLKKLLTSLVSSVVHCATVVGETIVNETTRRVTRLTQAHIHRRNVDEGSGNGAIGAIAIARGKDAKNGAFEMQFLLMRDLSGKILSLLRRQHSKLHSRAHAYMSAAATIANNLAALPSPSSATVASDATRGEGEENKQEEDADKKEEKAARREVLEEQRRQHKIIAQQAYDLARTYSGIMTNLLFATASASASSNMVIANKAAKSIFEQMKNGDPHAGRLTTMPYAGNLFVIYSENCAPASGYVRQDGDARDTNSRDILRLLGALASEAVKDMDDQTLNVHLSSLCNAVTDSATDALQSLSQDHAVLSETVRDREHGNSAGADRLGDTSGKHPDRISKGEKAGVEKRQADGAMCTIEEACMWLKLFFEVRKDTRDACKASCWGALTDLERIVDEKSEEEMKADLLKSMDVFRKIGDQSGGDTGT